MSSLELQQLRRVAGAVARLRGETVRDVTVRSDLRLDEWVYRPGIPTNAVPADPQAFARGLDRTLVRRAIRPQKDRRPRLR